VPASSYLSASTRIFEESAQQLAIRLERDGSAAAMDLARQARALAAAFTDWQRQRPPDDVRVETIERLFELNRLAMDYFGAP
jgi:hypothetical protein